MQLVSGPDGEFFRLLLRVAASVQLAAQVLRSWRLFCLHIIHFRRLARAVACALGCKALHIAVPVDPFGRVLPLFCTRCPAGPLPRCANYCAVLAFQRRSCPCVSASPCAVGLTLLQVHAWFWSAMTLPLSPIPKVCFSDVALGIEALAGSCPGYWSFEGCVGAA